MATGIGALIPVAMTLVGIVTMARARARRRSGNVAPDAAFEKREAARAEMERRMASYLAQRDMGGHTGPDDGIRQENGR